MSGSLRFPDGFEWGVATSAYQIEGAVDIDGRSPSIWDDFCARPGAISDGSSGAVALDHYHRYREDVAAIAELGVTAYRFSIAWPRVVRADGSPNPAGLAFYSRLVDTILEHGIRPWVTLYHWDLPSYLPGGWTARDTAARFAEYAALAHHRLGDRVDTWTTLNEPWCSALLGYGSGEHAPGRTDPVEALTAAHHLLLGHGLAVQALRAQGAREVGITLNFSPVIPADPDRAADRDVARRVDGLANRFFVDAIFRGAYPADVLADAAPIWPEHLVRDGDLGIIASPIDVLGVNYYSSWAVAAPGGAGQSRVPGDPSGSSGSSGSGGSGGSNSGSGGSGSGGSGSSSSGSSSSGSGGSGCGGSSGASAVPSAHLTAPEAVAVPRGLPCTAMGWEVDPDALRTLLTWLQSDYTGPAGIPIYVTENGAAYADEDRAGEVVQDHDRIDYLRGHLTAAHQAIADGVDLRGYFAWSFVDNFEWAHGYARTFGLLWVDAELARHPKLSSAWFSEVATSGSLDPAPTPAKMGP